MAKQSTTTKAKTKAKTKARTKTRTKTKTKTKAKARATKKTQAGSLLLVDVGNSYVKWAHTEDGTLVKHDSAPRPGAADVEVWADEHWGAYPPPNAVLVCSVSDADFARELDTWCSESWQVTPRYISARAHAGDVTNAYPEPQRLGADRWAALIAARAQYRGPVCVIDCGTAITIDAIAADGRHQGGLIIPGLGLMRRSLVEQTAGIRYEEAPTAGSEISLLAIDTQSAVQGGTLYAAVAFIDRVLADLSAELGDDLSCLITGGDAPSVLPLLSGVCHHVPDLVLQGLALLAEDT